MRNEGAARERNVVGFDLGGVEDAQEECKVGPHAEEEPNMDCESDGGEDGERVRLLPKPRTPSKAEWECHVVSHAVQRLVQALCGREGSRTSASEASGAR